MPRTLVGRILLLPFLALLALDGGNLRASPESRAPVIVGLSIAQWNDQYQISFRLDSAFDQEILGDIASGLETAFEYRVEVLRRRRFWLDEQIVARRIQTVVEYDGLSRQYRLTLKVDGQVDRSFITDKAEEMRRWMTDIRGITLGPLSGFVPPEDFIVRVKSDLRPHFILLFIPWTRDTGWVRIALGAGSGDGFGPGR